MVQVGPDTGVKGWDWCSGYHSIPVISEAIIQDQKGFSYELAYDAMKIKIIKMTNYFKARIVAATILIMLVFYRCSKK